MSHDVNYSGNPTTPEKCTVFGKELLFVPSLRKARDLRLYITVQCP
jgi:hypothetical protein